MKLTYFLNKYVQYNLRKLAVKSKIEEHMNEMEEFNWKDRKNTSLLLYYKK